MYKRQDLGHDRRILDLQLVHAPAGAQDGDGAGLGIDHFYVGDEVDFAALDHAGLLAGFGSFRNCLLYTSDAADERSSVDLGGRRIIKKKKLKIKKKK